MKLLGLAISLVCFSFTAILVKLSGFVDILLFKSIMLGLGAVIGGLGGFILKDASLDIICIVKDKLRQRY